MALAAGTDTGAGAALANHRTTSAKKAFGATPGRQGEPPTDMAATPRPRWRPASRGCTSAARIPMACPGAEHPQLASAATPPPKNQRGLSVDWEGGRGKGMAADTVGS